MNDWGTPWAIWAGGTLVGFTVLEATALIMHREDRTLSAHIRRVLGIDPPNRWRRLGSAAFLATLWAFTLWFGPHIVLG